MGKDRGSGRPRRAAPSWLLLSAALLVACGAGPRDARGAPQIDVRSLARVTTLGPDGGTTGTGFLVRSGYIVTAYHVVYRATRIDIKLAGRTAKDVNVVAVRPEADLALLSAPAGSPAGSGYRTVEAPAGAAGAEIYIHGLPLGFDNQLLVGRLTQSGYMLSQSWADRQGRILFAVRNLSVVPLDVTSEPGVSGAPVLDAHGNVFGVFSGSLQAGGRGYSWAVPITYADLGRMRPIGRRASQIDQWPAFVYLRPGLSLLRSLDQSSKGARLARHCRDRIDAYSRAWESQLDAAHHFAMKWSMVEPSFDSIVRAAKQHGARAQKNRLHFVWQTVEPQAEAFAKTQDEFEKSTARMMTACYSQTLLDSLLPRGAPATRGNIIFERKIYGRITALDEAAGRARAAFAAFARRAQAKVDEMMALGGAADPAGEEEAVQRLLKATALMAESMSGVLSSEQAAYISSLVQGAGDWAEIMEAIELHPWEREYRTYAYRDPSGVALTLSGGWVALDKEVRAAVLAPGKSFPQNVAMAKFNTVGKLSPIKAIAYVSWRPAYSPRSLADSQWPVYRSIAKLQWRQLQQAEGTTFADSKQYMQRVGTYLLLEMTGSGRLRNGKPVRAYLGQHVTVRGTASVSCMLLTPDADYKLCTPLTDSMRLPN